MEVTPKKAHRVPVGLGVGVTWPLALLRIEDRNEARKDYDPCDTRAILMCCLEDALRADDSRVINFVRIFAVSETFRDNIMTNEPNPRHTS